MQEKPPYYRVKSVEKTLRILEVISQKGEVSLSELSRLTNLTKTNVHRLLLTLAENGFVISNKDGSLYRLALKLFVLGSSVNQNSVLIEIASPHLEKLSSLSRETINLGVLYNDEVLYLHKIHSTEYLRIDTPIAKTDPAHATALGKCLLASFDRDELASHIENINPLKPLTKNTITDPLKLMWEVEEVRKNGFAIDREEVIEGVRCIAAPVKDRSSKVIAAISISGPSVRMTEDKTRKLKNPLLTAASSISKDYHKFSIR